ncbi:hypothetical protein [Desulfosporosinus burensis]
MGITASAILSTGEYRTGEYGSETIATGSFRTEVSMFSSALDELIN